MVNMLDPASAIGLAASIVQIVTFVKEVASRTQKLTLSTSGALTQHTQLQDICTRFQKLEKTLDEQIQFARRAQTVENDVIESELESLCTEAKLIIHKFLDLLEKLKLKSQRSTWTSLRHALRTLMKEEELQELELQLDRQRKQIDTWLLLSLRQWAEQSHNSQSHANLETKEILNRLAADSKEYSNVLRDLQSRFESQDAAEFWSSTHFSSALMDTFATDTLHTSPTFFVDYLIKGLSFENMPSRHDAIPEAYHRTFEWIFDSDGSVSETNVERCNWDNFSAWFISKKPIYWITGKPGAGKSTLMKFLFNSNRTLQLARKWVALSCDTHEPQVSDATGTVKLVQRTLTFASFYFWNSGSKLQMSKVGLLRTLLCQLLPTSLSIVTTLFPDRWRQYQLQIVDSNPFDAKELTQAVQSILRQDGHNFVLFIDGLDEFEGESNDVASLVWDFASTLNVKLCASSRPWTAFEDVFAQSPKLRIEDLTRQDILTYIDGRFDTSRRFQELRQIKPSDATSLVKKITDKASGVFLWVYLVVESLLKGLQDGDGVVELQEQLNELPSELGGLFVRILNQLNPAYSSQASRIFQFFRKHPNMATLLGLFYSDCTLTQALAAQMKPMTYKEAEFEEGTMKRRLYSRCMCFLEIDHVRNRRPRVRYLHRTARDYLEQVHVWNKIRGPASDYDPDAALAISLLIQVKSINFEDWSPLKRTFREDLVKACFFMANTDRYEKLDKIAFLDEIQHTGEYAVALEGSTGRQSDQGRLNKDCWILVMGSGADLPLAAHEALSRYLHPKTIFDLAFIANFHWYIDTKLAQSGGADDLRIDGKHLLTFAVERSMWDLQNILLVRGADPNYRHSRQSSWQLLLETTVNRMDQKRFQESCQLLHALSCFLDHGADLKAVCLGLKARKIVARAIQDFARDEETLHATQHLHRRLELAVKQSKASKQPSFPRLVLRPR